MKVFLACFLISALTLASTSCFSREEDNENEVLYASLRNKMVEEQIISRGIKDTKVLDAMRNVPRHYFIPEGDRRLAYADEPIPIGYGQTISQPYIVALMTESLGLKGDEKILEIGTGSGYQAAILANMAKQVYTVEILKPLALAAGKRLKKLGYKNIEVKTGDGYMGWKEHSPYDCIIVTAAPPEIPDPLIDQLKIGGKMIVPVGTWFQELLLIEKSVKGISKKSIESVRFVPMIGKVQK